MKSTHWNKNGNWYHFVISWKLKNFKITLYLKLQPWPMVKMKKWDEKMASLTKERKKYLFSNFSLKHRNYYKFFAFFSQIFVFNCFLLFKNFGTFLLPIGIWSSMCYNILWEKCVLKSTKIGTIFRV